MTIPRTGRIALVVAWLLLGAVPGRAADADLEALVAAYLKAGREQAPGTVAARAYVEPMRPTSGPTPQPDVLVVLLPYSARLEADLDAVKAGLRDSVDAYTRAVGRVESARVDYERALVGAGGGALVRSEVTDAQGAARLGDVPAGEWLVLAWYEGGHTAKRFKLRDQDAKRYPQVPTNVTYSVVTYWRSRVTVGPSRTVEVTLTDRNPWITAARQESGNPSGPQQKTK
ncbi:MAG TPA: hypothetical protein VLK35_07500 [Methylomirabilota bacterium]|nr:hypothetical protein [Methylomirabilota bacterium]